VKGKARRAQYGDSVTMPECGALYLVEYLIELGITQGEQSLEHVEIESWQHLCGIELQPWEVRFVKRLSEAYLGESHAARDPDADAPWAGAPYVVAARRGMDAGKRQLNYFKSMK
jgi:hypothetical protein